MRFVFLKAPLVCLLILAGTSALASDVKDLSAYKTHPKARQLLTEYWSLFSTAKSLDPDSQEYKETFQSLLDLEHMLQKQGITDAEINQLRIESENAELLDSNKVASRQLGETLTRLGSKIDLLDETEVKTSLEPFFQSAPVLSERVKTLTSKLELNKFTHPEYAILLFRSGVGVIILRQLLDLGVDTQTLDTVQNSFLINLDQLASVMAYSPPANQYLISSLLKDTLTEAGGSGDPALTSTLATKWRENHPRRLDISLSIYGKSIREVLSIFKREPVFLLIGAWMGMGTKAALAMAAHNAGQVAFVEPLLMMDALIAGILGYASWFRYQINLQNLEKAKPIMTRNLGLKTLARCRDLLNLSHPTPKLLENP